MAVTCAECGAVRGTTDELPLEGEAMVDLTMELIKAVGPMVDSGGGISGAMDLVAYPLNQLRVPCPGCGAVRRWYDTRTA